MDFRNDPDVFQFAILADRTGGERPGVFTDAIRKLNLLQPEFVISVGDLIEGSGDRNILDAEWDEFDSFVEALENMSLYRQTELDSLNIEAVGIPSTTGHAYEMSIPISYIEERQGEDWRRIRLSIAVDDFDDPPGPLTQLWWLPA